MDRRTFLHAAGAAGLSLTARRGLGEADQRAASLLGLLEDTPRDRLTRELARMIRAGLRYQELLAALSLAAVRNVQPYPDVGYKYHAVMVLRAVHAATQQLPTADQWLPIVWAADYFKDAQAQEHAASGWRLEPQPAGTIPDRAAARRALQEALDGWDRVAADAAVTGLARAAGPAEVFAVLFAYGARDLRAIGHKAIAVSNAHALIAFLGTAYAEPILRSTVAALQNADAGPNPATHQLHADRAWRENQRQLRDIPPDWQQGHDDPGAHAALREALYHSGDADAGRVVVGFLRQGMSAAAVWQVLFATGAELLLHQPSIVLLHAQTTANALHYAYRVCHEERTRQLLLLQCAAFTALFCRTAGAGAGDVSLAALPAQPPQHAGAEALGEIFTALSAADRMAAARLSLGYLQGGGDAQVLIAQARHHLVYQATEAHDYKFAEAVFDRYAQLPVGPWRERYLSAGMAYFTAPAARPAPLIRELQELLPA